jgi:integrase
VAGTASDKPWWRSDRGAFFITIGGKQHNLGADEEAAKIQVARLKFEHLEKTKETPPPPSVLLVPDVIEEFLDWCQKHREPRTFEFYREKTQSFLDHLKAQGQLDLEAAKLRPIHLQKWADSHEDWKAGQKHQAIMSVQRAFNWAKKAGLIERSPVVHVEKPPTGKRELAIEWLDYRAMLDNTRAEEIHDLLTVRWETGCRPQEILRVEARHVDLVGRRWVFGKKESKGKKRIRIVYLSDLALAITKRLVAEHPAGRLWTILLSAPMTNAVC